MNAATEGYYNRSVLRDCEHQARAFGRFLLVGSSPASRAATSNRAIRAINANPRNAHPYPAPTTTVTRRGMAERAADALDRADEPTAHIVTAGAPQ